MSPRPRNSLALMVILLAIVAISAMAFLVVFHDAHFDGPPGALTHEHRIIFVICVLLAAALGLLFVLLRRNAQATEEAFRLAASAREKSDELEAARRAAQFAAERVHATLDAVADGILTVGENGTVTGANAAAARIFGHPGDSLIGRDFATLLANPGGLDRETLFLRLRSARYGDTFTGCRADGSTFPIDIAITVARQDGHRLYTGLVRDLSQRDRAEAALKLQTRRMEATLRTALDPIVITDAAGTILEFNPAAETCFDRSRHKAIGTNVAALLLPSRQGRLYRRLLARFRETGNLPFLGRRIETFARRADGTRFPAEVAMTTIEDVEGPILIAFVRDITRRRISERALRAARDRAEIANRTKSEFLAMITHELHTPLNGVLGVLGLLEDSGISAEQSRLVRTGRESGEALMQVISDILDFSKVEAGRLTMERLPFDLRDLVRGVSEIVAPRLAGRPVNLSVDFDPALPETLVGDPGRIRQVLLNLVGNAAKFTEQGSIAVSAEVLARDGDTARIRLAVGDTGIGIPKARQAELFTEFVSLDASHSRKYGGTGLGLAISRKLTRLMGGSIGFVSREGTGSRFWVELPLPVGSTPAAADPIEAAPVLVSADHARILLAEDNPTNTMVARIILENAGYHVDTAANGIEAVEAVRRFPYDAVLMDVAMPEMDGIAATAAIRAMTKRSRRVPVIAMTAYAASEFADRAAEAGFDDILPKPVNRLKMLAVLARFVATRPAGNGTGAAPAAAPIEDAPLIAEDRLAALAADTSADVLPDLIRSFLADSGNRIVAIRQGLANGDLAALEAAAHPLGSSSATFGALRLTDACRAVEAAARDGDAERATSLAADLLQLAEATRDAFAQRLGLARRAGDR